MSRCVLIDSLTDKELETISKDLQIVQEPSKYAFSAKPNVICLFDSEGDRVYLPFAYSTKYPRPERSAFSQLETEFSGSLRENQKQVKTEAVNLLNKTGSVVIAAACGFGKTAMSIYLAVKLKMRTLIVCHRIVLINQWKVAIHQFCPNAKIQVLTAGSEFQNADFYIINAINIPKHTRAFYSDIGTLIVDEAHIIMAEKLSNCMRYVVPRYVIGLSATPYRTDGLDALLNMYFGTEKIVRKLYRRHTVYKLETGFVPEVKLNRMGKVDWSSVLESQCNDEERNELVIKIVKTFSEKVFLILCKRVEQAKYLVRRLEEEKEDVTSLIGSNQEYEQKSRILVGTVQKTGVGFDHPRLNAMILASDVEQYFTQYLGRVFRREDTEPVIFDLVDDYSLLKKHFSSRNSVYAEHGGIVKDFRKEFPNFSF
jgi:superfamily II DNA or RNA helicase